MKFLSQTPKSRSEPKIAVSARKLLFKASGFSLTVLINVLSGLATFPIVILKLGPDLWATLSVAQSLGILGAVLIGWGWNIMGPATVATLNTKERGIEYLEAMYSRGWLFLFVSPLVVLFALWLCHGDQVAMAAACLAAIISALGATWFYVGESSPSRLLTHSTLPTLGFSLLSVTVLLYSNSILIYSLVQLMSSLCVLAISSKDILGRYPRTERVEAGLVPSLFRLSRNSHGLVAAMTISLYMNGPLVLVSIYAPVSLPVYAFADKILKYLRAVVTSFTQVTQGYVPSGPKELLSNRIRTSLFIATTFGVAVSIFYALSLNLLRFFFAQELGPIPANLSVPLGLSLACISISSVLSFAILPAIDKSGIVARINLMGASVGITFFATLGWKLGASGIAWSVALAELLILVAAAMVANKHSRGR